MAARSGAELLRGLKDNREIWIGDGRVDDVISHPDFAGAARGLAEVFDLQLAAPDDLLFFLVFINR